MSSLDDVKESLLHFFGGIYPELKAEAQRLDSLKLAAAKTESIATLDIADEAAVAESSAVLPSDGGVFAGFAQIGFDLSAFELTTKQGQDRLAAETQLHSAAMAEEMAGTNCTLYFP